MHLFCPAPNNTEAWMRRCSGNVAEDCQGEESGLETGTLMLICLYVFSVGFVQ